MTSTYTSGSVILDREADIWARFLVLAKDKWGESIDLAEDGWPGGLYKDNSIILGEINEILQEVYDAGSISNATGARLDSLVELIGLSRTAAAYSTVTLTLTATKATTVAAGKKYSTAAGVTFETDVELVFTGAGSSTVAATCDTVGPFDAAIGEVNILTSSVSGISACTNAAAATPGRYRETSSQLKTRHTAAVATSGDQDAASIHEAVSAVSGVSAVYVHDNDTNTVAADGTPAHTLHVSTIGGTAAAIAAAIANAKTAGVPTYGATSTDVYNSTTKQTKTINHDIAVETDTHLSFTLTTVDGVFPDDGVAQIKAALVTHYDDIGINDDVDFAALYGPIYSVPGHVATLLKLDTVDPPTGTSDLSSSALIRYTLELADIDITVV